VEKAYIAEYAYKFDAPVEQGNFVEYQILVKNLGSLNFLKRREKASTIFSLRPQAGDRSR